jgi:hypothetical protein
MADQNEIATRAYRIWEAAGRSLGRDQEHWHAAEPELDRDGARLIRIARRRTGQRCQRDN